MTEMDDRLTHLASFSCLRGTECPVVRQHVWPRVLCEVCYVDVATGVEDYVCGICCDCGRPMKPLPTWPTTPIPGADPAPQEVPT